MKMPIEPRTDNGTRLLDASHPLTSSAVLNPRLWVTVWVAVATLTTVLYLLPNAGPPGRAHLDKIAHVIAFGSIGFSCLLGSARRQIAAPLLMSFLLAMILEWLQSYVPGREYSMQDWAANLVGLGTGLAAAFVVRAWALRLPGRSS
jgi:VanZ family protein